MGQGGNFEIAEKFKEHKMSHIIIVNCNSGYSPLVFIVKNTLMSSWKIKTKHI